MCPVVEQGAKLALAGGSNSHEKDLQAVSGPPPVRASWEKNSSSAPRPGFQVGAQGVLSARAEHGADRPRLASSLLQSKRGGKAVWKLPGRSLGVWKPSLAAGTQGPLPLQSDLPKSASQAGVTLSPRAAGSLSSLEVGKKAPESGFSGLYCAASMWLLRCQMAGPAPKDLNS